MAQNLRGFGSQVTVDEFVRVKCAPQFCRRQWQGEFFERKDLLPENRVKREFDIVGNRRIFVFRQRPFNPDIFTKSPTFQSVIGDDFDQCSQRPACRLFPIFSVMKNLLDEDLLQDVNRLVTHFP